MAIPALLWRDYDDGVNWWECLTCHQWVLFGQRGAGVLGVDLGVMCTWCGVRWTHVMPPSEVAADRKYNRYVNQPRREIMRRPNNACEYHDPDWIGEGRVYPDVSEGVALVGAIALLQSLRTHRRDAAHRGCTCTFHAGEVLP